MPATAAKTLIAYYRVSTATQGRSGLGLEAQRQAVARFAEAEGFAIVAVFEEVETGKGSDALERRPQLAAAKARGTRLGNPRIAEAQAKGAARNRANAIEADAHANKSFSKLFQSVPNLTGNERFSRGTRLFRDNQRARNAFQSLEGLKTIMRNHFGHDFCQAQDGLGNRTREARRKRIEAPNRELRG